MIMKNYLLILFLCFPIRLFCQEEKPITQGHMLIGGSFIGYYSKADGVSTTQIIATPSFGYFVVNHLAVGLAIPFEYKNQLIDNYSIGVGPFVKCYLNNGIFFSLQAAVLYQNEYTTLVEPVNYKTTSIVISPGIGYSYFINNNISFEGGLFYEFISSEYKSSYWGYPDHSTTTSGLQLQLGFSIFL